MPKLVWDKTDFLSCFEVAPVVDDYETGYHYKLSKNGMRLELSVFPLASDIAISVYREEVEPPVISFTITNCSGTRYVNDSRGEFIEFALSQVFGDRFSRDYLIPVGVRLSAKPSISVELFTT